MENNVDKRVKGREREREEGQEMERKRNDFLIM